MPTNKVRTTSAAVTAIIAQTDHVRLRIDLIWSRMAAVNWAISTSDGAGAEDAAGAADVDRCTRVGAAERDRSVVFADCFGRVPEGAAAVAAGVVAAAGVTGVADGFVGGSLVAAAVSGTRVIFSPSVG
jgi:hypothetical protein